MRSTPLTRQAKDSGGPGVWSFVETKQQGSVLTPYYIARGRS